MESGTGTVLGAGVPRRKKKDEEIKSSRAVTKDKPSMARRGGGPVP